MTFSSLIFVCVFLPIVFLAHTLIPVTKLRNVLLIIASLIFYAYGEPVYVWILVLLSFVDYIAAIIMEKKHSKVLLIVIVFLNLGILAGFKYLGFALTTFNTWFGKENPVPQVALPIGISFFTFQSLSYVIDVYKGRIAAQKNYGKILLYISFFPQLIAGPIVKYRDISEEIADRKLDVSEMLSGFRRFVIGLGKKVFIANTMGVAADQIYGASFMEINAVTAWLGALAYMMQIYYDFGGYSDMAIGMGKMFGFHFRENFRYPYGALNIQDFWHKWHISLSEWFKEYLYIPLGGNRRGRFRTYRNKLIVFFCTGLWHGANWTFVLWGLFHGMFLLLEDTIPVLKKLPKVIGHCYTFFVVCVGFVLFRADTITQAGYHIRQMFTGFEMSDAATSLALLQLTPWFLLMFLFALIGMASIEPVSVKIREIMESQNTGMGQECVRFIIHVMVLLLLFGCMLRLSGNTYNPFIYFRF